MLLVDDNADAAESLGALLELAGHHVALAHRGQDGLVHAQREPPDAVLCDIGLPDIDGYEVARRFRADPALRRRDPGALSGYALDEDLRRAEEAGFDAHVAKPATLDSSSSSSGGLRSRRASRPSGEVRGASGGGRTPAHAARGEGDGRPGVVRNRPSFRPVFVDPTGIEPVTF